MSGAEIVARLEELFRTYDAERDVGLANELEIKMLIRELHDLGEDDAEILWAGRLSSALYDAERA